MKCDLCMNLRTCNSCEVPASPTCVSGRHPYPSQVQTLYFLLPASCFSHFPLPASRGEKNPPVPCFTCHYLVDLLPCCPLHWFTSVGFVTFPCSSTFHHLSFSEHLWGMFSCLTVNMNELWSGFRSCIMYTGHIICDSYNMYKAIHTSKRSFLSNTIMPGPCSSLP